MRRVDSESKRGSAWHGVDRLLRRARAVFGGILTAASVFAAVTMGLLAPAASAASGLTPAQSTRLVKTGCVANPGGCSTLNFDIGAGFTTSPNGDGSASAFDGPGRPTVTAHTISAATASTLAQGYTRYSWMVTGADPSDHTAIPIMFSMSMNVTASAGDNASGIGAASFTIDGGGGHVYTNTITAAACTLTGGLYFMTACGDAYGVPYDKTASAGTTISFSAFPNSEGQVEMLGSATSFADCVGAGGIPGLGGCGGAPATVNVFIDPYIYIDPVFLAIHPGYSIIVSDGISNAPVPEPETYALLLAGLGLLGWVGRRRKQEAA